MESRLLFGSKKLTEEFRKVHQFVTFSTPTPFQYALADYIQDPSTYQSLSKFYQEKRDLFCEGLETTDFTFTPAQGSFFQLVSYKHLSNEPDLILAKRLDDGLWRGLYSDLSVFPR